MWVLLPNPCETSHHVERARWKVCVCNLLAHNCDPVWFRTEGEGKLLCTFVSKQGFGPCAARNWPRRAAELSRIPLPEGRRRRPGAAQDPTLPRPWLGTAAEEQAPASPWRAQRPLPSPPPGAENQVPSAGAQTAVEILIFQTATMPSSFLCRRVAPRAGVLAQPRVASQVWSTTGC